MASSSSLAGLSPSPASAQSPAASAQSHLNSIMRPIQTHVRVLGYPEYFHYSRDRVLTLSKIKNAKKTAADPGGAAPAAPAAPLSPAENPLDRSNVVCEAKLTNLHAYGQPTDKFFEAAVAPCIESALSGQSFVFLVAGPGRSGRSQTVYGDNGKMKGIVELTAERLLQQIGDGDYLSRGNVTSSPTPKAGAANAGLMTGALGLAPTVTYSCYGCVGDRVMETTTGEPVELREFPAPMGLMPLPRMNLLEIPRHAVCIPKNKNASYFTQFQIVKPLMGGGGGGADAAASSPSAAAASANGRRCAQSTITFIDLVQVVGAGGNDGGLHPDLAALFHAVSASANGGDPMFHRCALTRLLEQSIVGSTTMIPIATVTGLSDFFADTTATLKFVESFGSINQVLSLVNIVIPSWLRTAYEDLRANETENDQQLTSAYQRGCYDAYVAVTNVLGGPEAKARKEAAVFDGISNKVAELRSVTYKAVQEENGKVTALINAEKAEADAAESKVDRDPNFLQNQQYVNNGEEEVRRHEAMIQQLRSDTESTILYCKNGIAARNEQTAKRERELEEHEDAERHLKKAVVQRSAAWSRRAEDVAAAHLVDCSIDFIEQKLGEISQLETYVTEGSLRAKDATTAERTDRELRARLMRVTQLERQAQELRERIAAAANVSHNGGVSRSATPQTTRAHPVTSSSSTAAAPTVRGGSHRRVAPAAPTSRYLSHLHNHGSSASPSSQSPAAKSAAAASTRTGGASKASPSPSSTFSPLGKALSMTTNAVVSVQSILGNKSGGAQRSLVTSSSSSSVHNSNNNANGGSVRITNCLIEGVPQSLSHRGTMMGSSRSSAVPPKVPLSRAGGGVAPSSSSAHQHHLHADPNGTLPAKVLSSSSRVNTNYLTVPSTSYGGASSSSSLHKAAPKMIIPMDVEDDDGTNDNFTTTFIASP